MRGTRAKTRERASERGGACLSLSQSEMDTTRRKEGDGEGEDEDGNENGGGGGGGVTEMFRRQTIDAPFVRSSFTRSERDERNAFERRSCSSR